MDKLCRKALLITLSLNLCMTARAQRPRIYDTSDGLPGSRISDIRQDKMGFIWIAGEDGLSCFDGSTFRTFQPEGSGRIAGSDALAILEDSHGVLWTGTTRGLQTFSPVDGKFRTIAGEHTTSIIEFTPDKGSKSEIWAGSESLGISVFDSFTEEVDTVKTAMVNANLPSMRINELFPDSQGRIWAAFADGGFCAMDGVSGAILEAVPERDFPSAPHITCFAEDLESGTVMMGSSDAGLLLHDAAGGPARPSSDQRTRAFRISAIIKDATSDPGAPSYILGTDGDGLRLYDFRRDALREFGGSMLPEGADKWKVRSLMLDRQGNLWVGAYLSGLAIIPKQIYGFSTVSTDGSITALVIDRSGTIWAGTSGQGLLRLDNGGSKATYDSHNSSLPDGIITGLDIDRHGNLWIGTDKGLHIKAKGAHEPKRFSAEDYHVTDLEYDRERDRLYVGTTDAGLLTISPGTGNITSAGGSNLSVGTLHIDNDGIVWAGTGRGLQRYDPVMDRFTQDSLTTGSAATIHCFYESSDGNMWIGTSSGLVCFSRSYGESTKYTTDDGLPGDVICGILEDGDGDLWISTTRGLGRFSASGRRFAKYSKADGLKDDEFTYRSACAAEDGRLIFGSINGLTAFYPDDTVEPSGPAAPVILTDFIIGGRKAEEVNLTGRKDIRLPGGTDSFTAKFSVLEYTSPGNITCTYKLEGLDKDWSRIPDGTRQISRERLPAGRYVLRIKATDNNMPSEFSECSLPVNISAPWYRRWWAYGAEAIAVLAILWFASLSFTTRRMLRRREEESGIKDFKLQMASDLSEELRTPMTLVLSPLQEMREEEKDPKKKDIYNMMCRNCQRIIRSLNQMSDLRRLDSGELEFHFRETDIVYFVKDILRSFRSAAETRGIRLGFNTEKPEQKLWIDQGHFDKIIFNLLSNALKHTPDGGRIQVDISSPKGDGTVNVSIFYSCDKPADTGKMLSRGGGGPGLYLAYSLSRLQHGELSAANVDGGVMFSLLLPCGHAHLSAAEMSPTERHKDLYTRYSTDIEETTVAEEEDDKERKSRKTIVVTGFESEIRNYLKSVLRQQYNIRACADTKNAWGIISTTVPDAVITGMDSGGANGLELCSRIKHNPDTNHIPVIILSTNDDEETAEESTRTGADLYLRLPVSIERLRGSLANVISARETIRNKYTNEVRYDYGQIKPEGKGGGNFIEDVTSIINRNIGNPAFTVNDLSREAGISRVHLNRKLKDALNVSPGNLIRSIKMKQAAYLLIHNDVSIAEVARCVGFTSPSYFTSSFHDYFGMTPKEFLGKYRGRTDPGTLERLLGRDGKQA